MILSAVAENFLPFKRRVEIPVANLGLVRIVGDNRVSGAADSNGCLSGNTLIDCPRDLTKNPRGIPIRSLVGKEFLTYSWDGDRMVLRRAYDVRVTGARPVVKVIVGVGPRFRRRIGRRNGGSVFPKYWAPLELVGTSDHRVLLTSGAWKALGDLRRGDRIVSMYRRETPRSRALIQWTGGPARVSEQQFVCEAVNGPRPAGAEAYHRDDNGFNNTPSNLEWKNATKHHSEHTSKRNRLGLAGWQRTGVHPRGMKGKKHSAATKARISATLRKIRGPNHRVWSVGPESFELVYDMTVEGTSNFIANGMVVHNSGKSSLLSAISFGAYGKTLDGREADDVCNRFAKGRTSVEVVGEDPLTKVTWKVVRTRRPASVELFERVGESWKRILEDGDAKDVLRWVEARYLPWRVFRNAVVFDRWERFGAQDQGEQLRMLDAIQGVDFRAALERAKAWRAMQAAESADATAEAVSEDSAATTARERVAELEAIRDAFRRGKAARVRDAEVDREAAVELLDATAKKVGAFQKAELAVVAARKSRAAIAKLDDALDGRRTSLQDAERDVERAERREAEVVADVDALVKAGACPTCRRPVKSRDAVSEGFAEQLAAARANVVASRAAVRVAERAEEAAREVLTDALKGRTVESVEVELKRLEGEASPSARRLLDDAVIFAKRRLNAADAALSVVRSEKWDGDAAIRAAERSVVEHAAASFDAGKRVASAATFTRVAAYAVEAFGDRGLRALLTDGCAAYLTERQDAHLATLAAGEARVDVSATTALKGGGTRDRLSVVPTWDWGGVGRAAESEGQDARTAIAMFAALQDLAEAASPRKFGLRCYDEPGRGLDARGLELFAGWLAAEARRQGTVFLVTHDRVLAELIEPDETWTVVLHGPGDATLERG